MRWCRCAPASIFRTSGLIDTQGATCLNSLTRRPDPEAALMRGWASNPHGARAPEGLKAPASAIPPPRPAARSALEATGRRRGSSLPPRPGSRIPLEKAHDLGRLRGLLSVSINAEDAGVCGLGVVTQDLDVGSYPTAALTATCPGPAEEAFDLRHDMNRRYHERPPSTTARPAPGVSRTIGAAGSGRPAAARVRSGKKTELLNAEISKLRTRLARSGRARAGDRRGDPQDQARRFAAKDLPRRYRPGVCCRSVSTGGGAAGAA
jgi:hypothetical protein